MRSIGFITTALENGAQLEDVQKAAGHRDPGTTKLYDRRGCEGAGAVQHDFSWSACHSMEPIAHVVWVVICTHWKRPRKGLPSACGPGRDQAATVMREGDGWGLIQTTRQ
jgi:hypothetical protein